MSQHFTKLQSVLTLVLQRLLLQAYLLYSSQVLHILDPNSFDSSWVSKVTNVGDNKRLRLNNVRKVLTGTVDYLKDVVGMQLSQFPLPDTNKVVECDKSHLGRMLQLILGVAINCRNREEHIQTIWQEMEQESQILVMQAIQELQEIQSQSLVTPMDDGQVRKLMEEMEAATAEKEKLAQKCISSPVLCLHPIFANFCVPCIFAPPPRADGCCYVYRVP